MTMRTKIIMYFCLCLCGLFCSCGPMAHNDLDWGKAFDYLLGLANSPTPVNALSNKKQKAYYEKEMSKKVSSIHHPFVLTVYRASQIYAFSFGEDTLTTQYVACAVSDIMEKTHILYDVRRFTSYKDGKYTDKERRNVSFKNDTLCLNTVPLMSFGTYESGYSFKIPPVLKVDDVLETGTLKQTKNGKETIIIFSNFKVEAEEDVITRADTFHCYKIGGLMNGMIQDGSPLESTAYAIWVAPKVGLVKAQTDYQNMTLVLDSIVYRQ